MTALVLTACTNRKRVAAETEMRAASLPSGTLPSLAKSWLSRVEKAGTSMRADRLYMGRGFLEALAAAEGGNLYVVSAGLGIVHAETEIPAYSLTVSPGTEDNVLALATGAARPDDWWRAGPSRSCFHTSLRSIVARAVGQLVLVALPRTYLMMIADDLSELAERVGGHLRVFCASTADLPQRIREAVVPYDVRLDGPDSPLPGTRSDFAQRAMRHFVKEVLPRAGVGSIFSHRVAVENALDGLRPPSAVTRNRVSDSELSELIIANWDKAGGSSARMLRLLRDQLGVACEQGRFTKLFRQALEGTKQLS